MRLKFLLILIIFTLINTFLFSAKSIVFKFEIPKKDEKWIEINKTNMHIKITGSSKNEGDKTYETGNNKLIKKEITILDADEKKVNKIKVRYIAVETRFNENGEEANKDYSILLNNSYIVERNVNNDKSGGKFTVKYENGDIPSNEEQDYILTEEYNSEKDFDFNSSEVKDRKISIGEKVDCFNYLFDEFIGEFEKDAKGLDSKKNYSVILKAIKKINGKDCGIFDINLKLKLKDVNTNMILNLDLKGDIIIDINSTKILKLDITGPLTIDGDITNGQDTIILKGNGFIEHLYDQTAE
jgi:hypothetical protein